MNDYDRFLAVADELRQKAEGLRGWQRSDVLKSVKMFEGMARNIKRLIDSGYDWDAPPPGVETL